MAAHPSLTDALAAAAASRPGVPAPNAEFLAFARDRLDDGDGLDDATLAASAHLADLLVTYHAARGEPAALQYLGRLLEALRAPLRRTGANAGLIDELVSDLPTELISPRAGVPPRLHGYAGRGPLPAWLRVVAVRALIERRRKHGSMISDDALAGLASPDLDPELALLRRRYATEFRAAFVWAVAGLPAEDRALLRQHHLDGVGLDALARLHGIHRATVARRLASTRGAIFDRVRRRLLRELRAGTDTVDSILRIVQSELEVSFAQYL